METAKSSENLDEFDFLRNTLKDFQYPNLHAMDKNQIASIFEIPNRQFLISWLLQKINKEYEIVLENNNSPDFLGELLYEHGFCKFGDHKDFMTGKLPHNKQFEIFHRIFSYLKNILSNTVKSADDNNYSKIDLNSIVDLKNQDLNLFPCYGKLKLLSKKEKLAMINAFKEEIEHLEELQKNSSGTCKKQERKHNFTDEELKKMLEDLKLELPNLREIINKGNDEMFCENNEIHCNEEAEKCLEEFCQRIHIISQYIKDLKEIDGFFKNKTIQIERNLNDEDKMVKALVDELRKND